MRLRFLALLATLAMILALVAGCGKAANQAGSGDQGGSSTNQSGGGAQSGENSQPGGDSQSGEKIKVAFVYVGPVGDMGWSYAHDLGRQYLVEHLGEDKVETKYIENVPETADAERVFEQLAQEGYKVIFGTSFGYMDFMLKVAQRHPDVVFLHCSGYKTAPNMGTYFGRIEQPRYLSGIVAGLQTKANIIGYVAAHPIPEVIRGINAFTLGVRSVNPNARVKVVWTNTWYDPAKEKDAAKSLLDVGADVIAQHQDTPGPAQAAEEKGVWAVGYDSDFRQYAPKAFLTAPVWNWGPYYLETVKAVMDGTWKSEQHWGYMSEGIVELAPIADFAHPDAAAKVEEVKKKMLDGSFDWSMGPIKDQSGNVKVPEGSKLSDEEQLSMNWFVEGVDGTIPSQ